MDPTTVLKFLQAGRAVQFETSAEVGEVSRRLDGDKIPHRVMFNPHRPGGSIRLVFATREFPRRYIRMHRYLVQLDSSGIVVGRIIAAPLDNLLENGHPAVFWDNRSGQCYDLQIGDQYVPPEEGYPF